MQNKSKSDHSNHTGMPHPRTFSHYRSSEERKCIIHYYEIQQMTTKSIKELTVSCESTWRQTQWDTADNLLHVVLFVWWDSSLLFDAILAAMEFLMSWLTLPFDEKFTSICSSYLLLPTAAQHFISWFVKQIFISLVRLHKYIFQSV